MIDPLRIEASHGTHSIGERTDVRRDPRAGHLDFLESGMIERELDTLLEEVVSESPGERRRRREASATPPLIDTPPPDCLN